MQESPGFIYAYELRDLQTPTTSFFKVGRTDNVPRRMGEWANRMLSRRFELCVGTSRAAVTYLGATLTSLPGPGPNTVQLVPA